MPYRLVPHNSKLDSARHQRQGLQHTDRQARRNDRTVVEDPQIIAVTGIPWRRHLIASWAVPDTRHGRPTNDMAREHLGAPLIRQYAYPRPSCEGCPGSECGALEPVPSSRRRGIMFVVDHVRAQKDPQYQGHGAREPFGRIDPARPPPESPPRHPQQEYNVPYLLSPSPR